MKWFNKLFKRTSQEELSNGGILIKEIGPFYLKLDSLWFYPDWYETGPKLTLRYRSVDSDTESETLLQGDEALAALKELAASFNPWI